MVWSWKLKPNAKEQIDALIGDICVSLRKEDYLTMPQRQDIVHTIEWERAAKQAYNTMRKEMVVEVEEETLTAASAGVLTGKLLCKSKTPHIRKAGLDILASFLRGFPTAPPAPTPRSIDSDESIPLPAGSAMQAVQALKKDTSAVNSPGRQVIEVLTR